MPLILVMTRFSFSCNSGNSRQKKNLSLVFEMKRMSQKGRLEESPNGKSSKVTLSIFLGPINIIKLFCTVHLILSSAAVD